MVHQVGPLLLIIPGWFFWLIDFRQVWEDQGTSRSFWHSRGWIQLQVVVIQIWEKINFWRNAFPVWSMWKRHKKQSRTSKEATPCSHSQTAQSNVQVKVWDLLFNVFFTTFIKCGRCSPKDHVHSRGGVQEGRSQGQHPVPHCSARCNLSSLVLFWTLVFQFCLVWRSMQMHSGRWSRAGDLPRWKTPTFIQIFSGASMSTWGTTWLRWSQSQRRPFSSTLTHRRRSVSKQKQIGASNNQVTVPYDLLHVTPPMSTPDPLNSNASLADAGGFLDVNKETLQHNKWVFISTIRPHIFKVPKHLWSWRLHQRAHRQDCRRCGRPAWHHQVEDHAGTDPFNDPWKKNIIQFFFQEESGRFSEFPASPHQIWRIHKVALYLLSLFQRPCNSSATIFLATPAFQSPSDPLLSWNCSNLLSLDLYSLFLQLPSGHRQLLCHPRGVWLPGKEFTFEQFLWKCQLLEWNLLPAGTTSAIGNLPGQPGTLKTQDRSTSLSSEKASAEAATIESSLKVVSPFQAKERWSMYQLKAHFMPQLYWFGLIKVGLSHPLKGRTKSHGKK